MRCPAKARSAMKDLNQSSAAPATLQRPLWRETIVELSFLRRGSLTPSCTTKYSHYVLQLGDLLNYSDLTAQKAVKTWW